VKIDGAQAGFVNIKSTKHARGDFAHVTLNGNSFGRYRLVVPALSCTGEDVTYSLGRPLNELAGLFVDETLLDRLKELAKVKPQVFSPSFFEEANEARMLNHDWLRFQGTDACKWLASAVQRGR